MFCHRSCLILPTIQNCFAQCKLCVCKLIVQSVTLKPLWAIIVTMAASKNQMLQSSQIYPSKSPKNSQHTACNQRCLRFSRPGCLFSERIICPQRSEAVLNWPLSAYISNFKRWQQMSLDDCKLEIRAKAKQRPPQKAAKN